jgi:hypothetical protein
MKLNDAMRCSVFALEQNCFMQMEEAAFNRVAHEQYDKRSESERGYVFIFASELGESVTLCTLAEGFRYASLFADWRTVVIKRKGSGNATGYARVKGKWKRCEFKW